MRFEHHRTSNQLSLSILAMVIILLLGGCGVSPDEVTIKSVAPISNSDPTIVQVGDGIGIAVEVDNPGNLPVSYEWDVTRGKIRTGSDTSPAAVYEASDTPGVETITVFVKSGDEVLDRQSLQIEIVRTGAASTTTADQNPLQTPSPGILSTTEEITPTPSPEITPTTPKGTPPPTPSYPSIVNKILAEMPIKVGVQFNFPPFSFETPSGDHVGFEIDLIHEFSRRWYGDPDAIEIVPVLSENRLAALESGLVDMVVATLTHTTGREEHVDFSVTYFQDGQRLLVLQGEDSISNVCDLAGREVGVIENSTGEDNIRRIAVEECGFSFDENGLVPYSKPQVAVNDLRKGAIDVFTSDSILLENFAGQYPVLKVVGNHFSQEPYGIAVPKGDTRFQNLVNLTLREMDADGDYAAIYQGWFEDEISPYPLSVPPGAITDPEIEQLARGVEAPPIDSPTPDPTSSPAPQLPAQYTVQEGDWLSTIAAKFYGDPLLWEFLFDANRAVLDNPNSLKVGDVLTIPKLASE